MIRDAILTQLVNEQTEAFNKESAIEIKVAILEKIQKRQEELKILNKS